MQQEHFLNIVCLMKWSGKVMEHTLYWKKGVGYFLIREQHMTEEKKNDIFNVLC
jgi:hypothetical protein